MDIILSEFVAHTSSDPGLARDLLDAHDWNLHSALSAYYEMKGLLPGEVPISDSDISSSHHRLNGYHGSSSLKSNTGSRPPLKKLPAFDVNDDGDDANCAEKKLTRGISHATDNFSLVSRARSAFAEDFDSVDFAERPSSIKLEIPEYSFSLPDFSVFPENLREYLQKDLIETATLVSLEHAGRLNWWYFRKISRKLWPLSTTGDGNCLLHAASLGMWGFHDRLLTLRKALHSLLTNSTYTDAFYRRWRWQTSLQNKEAGLIFNEDEWEKEWQNLLKLSSSEPRQSSLQRNSKELMHSSSRSSSQSEVYESLEELHVLALAHVLKRAIIVISDTVLRDVTGEPLAPIPFGGVYLPLECPPGECHKSPLCLTFDSAHFSALVPMDDASCAESFLETRAAIPVTDPDNRLLPLQFAVDPGPEITWGQDENDPWVTTRLTPADREKIALLNDYLDIGTLEVDMGKRNDEEKPTSSKEVNGQARLYEPYESDDSEGGISCTGGKRGKNKAAKQLQTVAKQFGSIGRSMSKKLKHFTRRSGSFKGEAAFKRTSNDATLKNKRTLSGGLPGTISRTSSSSITEHSDSKNQVVIAILNTEKTHEYQKRLVQNYLSSAISRFASDKLRKNGSSQCVSPGCLMHGSPSTSYLCSDCHSKQKLEFENGYREGLVITSGKSSFYMESDRTMRDSVDKLPVNTRHNAVGLKECSNSLFYDKSTYNGSLYSSSTSSLGSCKGVSHHNVDSYSSLRTIEESSTM